jgi:ribosomal protein L40E
MIQVVKDTIQCSRCGCIALPDATKCPKCGASYIADSKKEQLDSICFSPTPIVSEDSNTKVVRAYYQLTCSRHGKILVKAAVIGSSIKCPFCQY